MKKIQSPKRNTLFAIVGTAAFTAAVTVLSIGGKIHQIDMGSLLGEDAEVYQLGENQIVVEQPDTTYMLLYSDLDSTNISIELEQLFANEEELSAYLHTEIIRLEALISSQTLKLKDAKALLQQLE